METIQTQALEFFFYNWRRQREQLIYFLSAVRLFTLSWHRKKYYVMQKHTTDNIIFESVNTTFLNTRMQIIKVLKINERSMFSILSQTLSI